MTKNIISPKNKINSTARNFVVQFLYQCESEKIYHYSDVYFKEFSQNFDLVDDTAIYAKIIIRKVFDNLNSIDTHIEQSSENWSLPRISTTDLCALRASIAEMMVGSAPTNVILDEWIEIAKVYGTDNSQKFVNGVLDTVSKKLTQEE